MKKHLPLILCGIIVLSLFLVVLFWASDNIGTPADKLEADIRQSQKIDDSWTVTGEVSDAMAAYISCPEDKSDFTFSVYVKLTGLSFGYFFRAGGSIYEIEEGILACVCEGCDERAFISMNAPKIARLEIDNGLEIKTREFDSEKPFAVVLPINAGELRFYDENGNIVEYKEQKM